MKSPISKRLLCPCCQGPQYATFDHADQLEAHLREDHYSGRRGQPTVDDATITRLVTQAETDRTKRQHQPNMEPPQRTSLIRPLSSVGIDTPMGSAPTKTGDAMPMLAELFANTLLPHQLPKIMPLVEKKIEEFLDRFRLENQRTIAAEIQRAGLLRPQEPPPAEEPADEPDQDDGPKIDTAKQSELAKVKNTLDRNRQFKKLIAAGYPNHHSQHFALQMALSDFGLVPHRELYGSPAKTCNALLQANEKDKRVIVIDAAVAYCETLRTQGKKKLPVTEIPFSTFLWLHHNNRKAALEYLGTPGSKAWLAVWTKYNDALTMLPRFKDKFFGYFLLCWLVSDFRSNGQCELTGAERTVFTELGRFKKGYHFRRVTPLAAKLPGIGLLASWAIRSIQIRDRAGSTKAVEQLRHFPVVNVCPFCGDVLTSKTKLSSHALAKHAPFRNRLMAAYAVKP